MRTENPGLGGLSLPEEINNPEVERLMKSVLPEALSQRYGAGFPQPEDIAAFQKRYGFDLPLILHAISRNGVMNMPQDEEGLKMLAENILGVKLNRERREILEKAKMEREEEERMREKASLRYETKPIYTPEELERHRIGKEKQQALARAHRDRGYLRQIYTAVGKNSGKEQTPEILEAFDTGLNRMTPAEIEEVMDKIDKISSSGLISQEEIQLLDKIAEKGTTPDTSASNVTETGDNI